MRVSADTREATRHRILEAAVNLFSDKGWDAATTRDIAAAAGIATGTLFNYFPTKDAIAVTLASDALARATEEFRAKQRADAAERQDAGTTALEENLFLLVWTGLRHLSPYRKFLGQALGALLSPLASWAATSGAMGGAGAPGDDIRANHMATVAQIMGEHGIDAPSPFSLQLYWSLYLGVLAHWTTDGSPHQEDTLALLDQSLILLVKAVKKQRGTMELADIDSEVDDAAETG